MKYRVELFRSYWWCQYLFLLPLLSASHIAQPCADQPFSMSCISHLILTYDNMLLSTPP